MTVPGIQRGIGVSVPSRGVDEEVVTVSPVLVAGPVISRLVTTGFAFAVVRPKNELNGPASAAVVWVSPPHRKAAERAEPTDVVSGRPSTVNDIGAGSGIDWPAYITAEAVDIAPTASETTAPESSWAARQVTVVVPAVAPADAGIATTANGPAIKAIAPNRVIRDPTDRVLNCVFMNTSP